MGARATGLVVPRFPVDCRSDAPEIREDQQWGERGSLEGYRSGERGIPEGQQWGALGLRVDPQWDELELPGRLVVRVVGRWERSSRETELVEKLT